jgi:hypothetical protein
VTATELMTALAEPFAPALVRWKPTAVKNNRCLALGYVDARTVQDRLDECCGIGGWRTEYVQIGQHSVECRLSVKVEGEWVTKSDVGSTSEQSDEGDRMKAAYSDAFKRAAVVWGCSRYLYRLSASWVDYDPVKKQIVQPPQLPAWALPKPAAAVTHQGKLEDEHRAKLNGAKTMPELEATWTAVPQSLKKALAPVKDARKAVLSASKGATQ